MNKLDNCILPRNRVVPFIFVVSNTSMHLISIYFSDNTVAWPPNNQQTNVQVSVSYSAPNAVNPMMAMQGNNGMMQGTGTQQFDPALPPTNPMKYPNQGNFLTFTNYPTIIRIHSAKQHILDPGLSEGVLCNHPCASFSPSLFNYLRDRPLVLSNCLHEVRAP